APGGGAARLRGGGGPGGGAGARRNDPPGQTGAPARGPWGPPSEGAPAPAPPPSRSHGGGARAPGNRHFADLMTYLGTMIIPRTRLNTASSAPEGRLAYLRRVHGEHQSIYNAIRLREPEAARQAMRLHLSNSRERLRRAQPDSPA
ncbi:MAG: FadR family transcriptional regulator, partial [Hydrogenophaga sp.]|nr:FadR family transcriptional regulator [Hydrogenophaga sp.]